MVDQCYDDYDEPQYTPVSALPQAEILRPVTPRTVRRHKRLRARLTKLDSTQPAGAPGRSPQRPLINSVEPRRWLWEKLDKPAPPLIRTDDEIDLLARLEKVAVDVEKVVAETALQSVAGMEQPMQRIARGGRKLTKRLRQERQNRRVEKMIEAVDNKPNLFDK